MRSPHPEDIPSHFSHFSQLCVVSIHEITDESRDRGFFHHVVPGIGMTPESIKGIDDLEADGLVQFPAIGQIEKELCNPFLN
jgi:hypothetical protein